MADNTITLVGNLTRDPELRFTTGGRGVASFGIAVGRRYQVNGEWQEQTSYFNITAWGQLGENAAATLAKGSRVIVTGRLEQREYTTRDGDKRTAIEVVRRTRTEPALGNRPSRAPVGPGRWRRWPRRQPARRRFCPRSVHGRRRALLNHREHHRN